MRTVAATTHVDLPKGTVSYKPRERKTGLDWGSTTSSDAEWDKAVEAMMSKERKAESRRIAARARQQAREEAGKSQTSSYAQAANYVCQVCSAKLVQRPDELFQNFLIRKTCSKECAAAMRNKNNPNLVPCSTEGCDNMASRHYGGTCRACRHDLHVKVCSTEGCENTYPQSARKMCRSCSAKVKASASHYVADKPCSTLGCDGKYATSKYKMCQPCSRKAMDQAYRDRRKAQDGS